MANKLTCIIKKSVAKDYGLLEITHIGENEVAWERAMTVKEAIKKVERLQDVYAVVIEDAREKEEETIKELTNYKGLNVILLGGDVVCDGAVRTFNRESVEKLLEVGTSDNSAGESSTEESSETTEIEESAVENREEPLIGGDNRTFGDEQNIEFNGIDPAKYEQVVRDRNNWRAVAENAKHELSILQDKMQEIIVDESVIEFMSSGVDGRELQRKVELLENEKKRLEETIKNLGGEKSLRRDVEDKLGKAENSITGLELSLMDERDASNVLREVMLRLTYYGRELIEQLAEARSNLAAIKIEKEDAIQVSDSYKKKFEGAVAKINSLEKQIADLIENITDVKESNEELSQDIIILEGDNKNLKIQLDETRGKLEKAIEEKEKGLDVVEEKEKELASYRAYKIDEMKNTIAQNESMAKEYETLLNEASIKEDALRTEVLQLKQKVMAYKEMADAANNRLKSRERVYNGDTFDAINVNYIGRAILVTVIGSGGYGTTAIAAAIAESLCASGNNVAIVDLDMRSPKLDAYYEKDPFKLAELDGKMQADDRKTSLGAMIKLGAEFWVENHETLGTVINPKRGRGEGKLMYHSGSYASLSATEMSGANYTAMLKELGGEYDYIIVDAGRFESSGSIASVQVGLCRASSEAFLVTNSSYVDVRSMRSRTINAKLKLSNICWVLNMTDEKVERDTLSIADDAEFVVQVPMVRNCYGRFFSLYENKKSHGAVEQLVQRIR